MDNKETDNYFLGCAFVTLVIAIAICLLSGSITYIIKTLI